MISHASVIALLVALLGCPAFAGLEVLQTTTDTDNVVTHVVRSECQSAPTQLRVLLPQRVPEGLRLPVVYLLPVEAGTGTRWGDPIREVLRQRLHERYRVAIVVSSFSQLPWYADHPTDAGCRQESYFVREVVPFVESRFPIGGERGKRLLVGFSKSGWGAWSLLLRYPDRFEIAYAWDAPLVMQTPQYGSQPIFGTDANFARYRLINAIESATESITTRVRLAHGGDSNFRDQHAAMQTRLKELHIPEAFNAGPRRRHHWESGWLEDALAITLRLAGPRPLPAPRP